MQITTIIKRQAHKHKHNNQIRIKHKHTNSMQFTFETYVFSMYRFYIITTYLPIAKRIS